MGEPNRRQDSEDDDEDTWVDEAPEDDGPGSLGTLGTVVGGMGTDGSLESLIAMLDRAYDPVAFGGAAQASLETSGLQDIRALVDEQLEAFEQLEAR